MLAQILTLVGTLAGAILGLFAQFLTSSFTRREHEFEVQRQIASDIIDLFENSASPAATLTPAQSDIRRKLYLLSLRLNDHAARRACMELIACAGQARPDESAVLDAWNVMMNNVGSVYRRTRRAMRR